MLYKVVFYRIFTNVKFDLFLIIVLVIDTKYGNKSSVSKTTNLLV